jgi:urocanate hydratase
MTKKARESKDHLNKEHSTLLEAFQTIYNSGFVKVLVTVVSIGAAILWRVEMLSMKVSDVVTDVKSHDDTLEVYRPLVWHRPAPAHDTINDTISHNIVEYIPQPRATQPRRSPYGGPVTKEE